MCSIYIYLITCKMQIVHIDNRLTYITADCDSGKTTDVKCHRRELQNIPSLMTACVHEFNVIMTSEKVCCRYFIMTTNPKYLDGT
jgi:hypothetical protein